MTMQDPSARLSRDATRSRHWRLIPARLRLRVPGKHQHQPGKREPGMRQPGQREPEARLRERSRQLALIDRALVTEAPRLASMFVMFNRLTEGEEPAGPERVPPPDRPRMRRAHLAVLLALAAVVALCVALSTQIHVPQPCPVGVSSASASAVSPLARDLSCAAYPANK